MLFIVGSFISNTTFAVTSQWRNQNSVTFFLALISDANQGVAPLGSGWYFLHPWLM